MKKEILKLAGVRSESQFYKLFPDEKSFMQAHGKEFKKLLRKQNIEKAQQGTEQAFNQQNAGMNNKATTQADVSGAISNLSTGTPKKTTGNVIADATKDIPILGSLVSGITGLWDAGAERKRQVRAGALSDLQLKASQSAPRPENRKYIRPDMDATVADANSLAPAEGTGSNLLAKYGGNVPRADWGSILSSVLSSKGGSGGSGGLLGNIIGGVLGGGGSQQTTTPTTTLDPSQYVIRNNFSPTYINKAQDGSWVDKVLNGNNGGVAGLVSSALTKGENKTGNLISNPTTSKSMEGAAGTISSALSNVTDSQMAQSAGKIGGAVGSVIPIPGASDVLSAVGMGIGAIAEDKSGKKALNRIQRNTNQMATTQTAKVLQGANSSFMRTGGNMRQNSDMQNNGELNTIWGGHAEPMSYNPYLPDGGETVMFRGNSHEEGSNGRTGIGVQYGDNLQPYDEANVEVERGEPAVQLPDETGEKNLVVFGNLPIPKDFVSKLGDERAKGKKFKNYISLLSKDENRQNKVMEKASDELKDFEPKTAYDKIKYDTLNITLKGADDKLRAIANKKEKAAHLQEAINQTAEEMRIDPENLAKGRIKALKGANIPKAQVGIGYPVEPTYAQKWRWGLNKDSIYNTGDLIEDKPVSKKTSKKNEKKGKENVNIRFTAPKEEATFDDEKYNRLSPEPSFRQPLIVGKRNPGNSEFEDRPSTSPKEKEKEERQIPQYFNPLSPYLPSSDEMLDPRQLTGEYYALATNQLEPVPAQLYHPDLDTPFEISLQDILNENVAATRGAQRMMEYNPAAQANIVAQQYAANQKVLGDQFRINQENKMRVYDKNRAILNDAQLKNLGILDQQYTRQAQAKSKTKDVTREALASISEKYLQNQLQNRTLRTYENMYNYRFDDRQHAWNMNPPAKWNMSGNGQYSDNIPENWETLYDKDGKPIEAKRKPRERRESRNGAILKAMKSI